MAKKDHSLDERITASARTEFMTYGFQKASINTIAQNAGLTTGAVYTRYKNKDALFTSLVQDAVEEMAKQSGPIAELYYAVKSKDDLDLFLKAMQAEMRVYLDVMFRHYDACVLLFCKSTGSSIEEQFRKMMDQKVETSAVFLETLAGRELPGIALILRQQMSLFRLVMESGYEKERAVAAIEMIDDYTRAGWKEIFETHMQ